MQGIMEQKSLFDEDLESIRVKMRSFFINNNVSEKIGAKIVWAVIGLHHEAHELEECSDEKHKQSMMQTYTHHKQILDNIMS